MGVLIGSVAASPSTVNQTTEGTVDWAHWALNTATTFDHKLTGGTQISNYAQVGGAFTAGRTTLPTTWTWTDGTPDATGSTSIAASAGIVGRGFSFTVPADTTTRVVNVYVGVHAAQGTMTATLSDGSAASYSDSSTDNLSSTTGVQYQFTYAANSASQTLTISWTMAVNHSAGNASLAGATMPTPPTPSAFTATDAVQIGTVAQGSAVAGSTAATHLGDIPSTRTSPAGSTALKMADTGGQSGKPIPTVIMAVLTAMIQQSPEARTEAVSLISSAIPSVTQAAGWPLKAPDSVAQSGKPIPGAPTTLKDTEGVQRTATVSALVGIGGSALASGSGSAVNPLSIATSAIRSAILQEAEALHVTETDTFFLLFFFTATDGLQAKDAPIRQSSPTGHESPSLASLASAVGTATLTVSPGLKDASATTSTHTLTEAPTIHDTDEVIGTYALTEAPKAADTARTTGSPTSADTGHLATLSVMTATPSATAPLVLVGTQATVGARALTEQPKPKDVPAPLGAPISAGVLHVAESTSASSKPVPYETPTLHEAITQTSTQAATAPSRLADTARVSAHQTPPTEALAWRDLLTRLGLANAADRITAVDAATWTVILYNLFSAVDRLLVNATVSATAVPVPHDRPSLVEWVRTGPLGAGALWSDMGSGFSVMLSDLAQFSPRAAPFVWGGPEALHLTDTAIPYGAPRAVDLVHLSEQFAQILRFAAADLLGIRDRPITSITVALHERLQVGEAINFGLLEQELRIVGTITLNPVQGTAILTPVIGGVSFGPIQGTISIN